MKRFIFISIFIILGGLGVYVSVSKHSTLLESNTESFNNFCGTQAFHDEATSKGKRIFNSHCAACHHLDKIMTGPALRNISQKYDTITIANYIKGKKHMIKDKGYANYCINFPQLSDQDISELLSYTN